MNMILEAYEELGYTKEDYLDGNNEDKAYEQIHRWMVFDTMTPDQYKKYLKGVIA